MSLSTELNALATAVGGDIKILLTNQGNLASLSTTQKGSIVAALNEVKAVIDNLTGGGTPAYIDDSKSTSTTDTWSIDKIKSERASAITTAISALESKLLNGAPAALDTLQELADALGQDANFATTITAALGKRVRVDDAQSFTAPEQAQARANIGAASSADLTQLQTDIGNSVTGLVDTYEAAKV